MFAVSPFQFVTCFFFLQALVPPFVSQSWQIIGPPTEVHPTSSYMARTALRSANLTSNWGYRNTTSHYFMRLLKGSPTSSGWRLWSYDHAPIVDIPMLTLLVLTFTKLDLRSACNFAWIQAGSEQCIAFNTTPGHYRYCVMPYALVTDLHVLNVNDIRQDTLERFMTCYTDNTLIHFKRSSTHLPALPWAICKNKNVKCEFHHAKM